MTVPVFGKIFSPTRSCAILQTEPTLRMPNLLITLSNYGDSGFGCRSNPGFSAA
jgi:hypothetical protein